MIAKLRTFARSTGTLTSLTLGMLGTATRDVGDVRDLGMLRY